MPRPPIYSGPKQPTPSGADLQTVVTRKRELKEQFTKQRTTSLRKKNPQKLYDQALTSSDAIEQFALLEAALDQATALGQYPIAKQILLELSARFDIDEFDMGLEFVREFAKLAKKSTEKTSVVNDALSLADKAIAVGDLNHAESFAKQAEHIAASARLNSLLKSAREKQAAIRTLRAGKSSAGP